MDRIFFIVVMLTLQLSAQIQNGLYYSKDIYTSDVNNYETYNTEKIDAKQYIKITDNGIRIYSRGGIGVYHAWINIGMFDKHYTYVLSNGSKVCYGPEIKGIYYFYDNEYDPIEYKKVIEFRNLKKVKRSNNYLMNIR